MEPFTYPDLPHVRRHRPLGYADADSYRPWLRDEFAFRCVFCLVREQWENPVGRFAVDHLQPQTRYPELAAVYHNLLYVCTSCNAVKGHQEVADPTQTLLSTTVVVQDDGTLVATTPAAAELLELLHLNYRTLCQRRQLLMAAVRVFREREPELYRRWMGFPDDLPDLSRLRPPGGNSRPEGVAQSCLARRERGELPATY
jgi:hypothetical protein